MAQQSDLGVIVQSKERGPRRFGASSRGQTGKTDSPDAFSITSLAREENQQMRDNGEYVKANRRKSRNIYELEQALEAAGKDNSRVKTAREGERKKDAALAVRI